MPIAVHCPNPDCAQVHQVKNKYGGMRGRCPACGSWMYVPAEGQMPLAVPRAAGLEKGDPWDQPELSTPYKPRPQPPRAPVPEPADEDVLSPIPVQAEARRGTTEPEPVEAEVVEAEEVEEKKPKKKHFSWLAILLLLLGILSLGVVMAAPYLPGPELEASGTFANLARPQGITAETAPYVIAAPGVVAFLAFLALVISLLRRRMGAESLLLVYLAVLGSSALLLIGLSSYKREAESMSKVEKTITERKEKDEERGDAKAALGWQHPALAIGPAAACVCFVLAGVFMHRRLWSKLLGFLVLAFVPALVAVWAYHQELGIDKSLIPYEWPEIDYKFFLGG